MAEPNVASTANIQKLIAMMRTLNSAGVTNFVLSDELYGRMQCYVERNNRLMWPDVPMEDKPLNFRNRRVFRESEIRA